MALVAGVLVSAPSTTVTLTETDAETDADADGNATGTVVREATVAHDPQDPDTWWVAVQRALAEVVEPDTALAAIVVGPAPGAVVLDAERRPLWVAHPGDIDAGPDAGWLRGQLGDEAWTEAIGRVPAADDTISALSWLHRSDLAAWARLAHVASPAAVLVERFTGRLATSADDAAATGCWSAAARTYRLDLLTVVDRDRDWSGVLPAVVDRGEEVGVWQGTPVVVG